MSKQTLDGNECNFTGSFNTKITGALYMYMPGFIYCILNCLYIIQKHVLAMDGWMFKFLCTDLCLNETVYSAQISKIREQIKFILPVQCMTLL